jgi:hypothetical protein
MNPDDIELENLSKIFEYERISRYRTAKKYSKMLCKTLF